jgi:hypothetical protein
MLRSNRSAWAFKFGNRGGSLTDSIPVSAIIFKNSAVKTGITIVNQASPSRVESRMGAGTDISRRPVSHPRSSNRTCGFPASGFPTGFVAESRAGLTQRSLEPEQP